MTPKEKAEELVKEFGLKFPMGSPDDFIFNQAKQCALICVDELLESNSMFPQSIEYWKKVKQEIDKL